MIFILTFSCHFRFNNSIIHEQNTHKIIWKLVPTILFGLISIPFICWAWNFTCIQELYWIFYNLEYARLTWHMYFKHGSIDLSTFINASSPLSLWCPSPCCLSHGWCFQDVLLIQPMEAPCQVQIGRFVLTLWEALDKNKLCFALIRVRVCKEYTHKWLDLYQCTHLQQYFSSQKNL